MDVGGGAGKVEDTWVIGIGAPGAKVTVTVVLNPAVDPSQLAPGSVVWGGDAEASGTNPVYAQVPIDESGTYYAIATVGTSQAMAMIKVVDLVPPLSVMGAVQRGPNQYVAAMNHACTITATLTPDVTNDEAAAVLGWSAGEPGLGWVQRRFVGHSVGSYLVLASCGIRSAYVTILVLNVAITEPNKNPLTDNHFSYNAATIGVCTITATGTTGVPSEDANLEWTFTGIPGATITSSPSPPRGSSVSFTCRGMPDYNDLFGKKTLTLRHSLLGDSGKAEQEVEIFFDGSDSATNHPTPDTGYSPNWYYYWCQTSAWYGITESAYNPQCPYAGWTLWTGTEWNYEIGPLGNDPYQPPEGDLSYYNLLSIDIFAHVCRHEFRHVETFSVWYPYGYDSVLDGDGDYLPDDEEAFLGGTEQNPRNGGPFYDFMPDSDLDSLNDVEDYTLNTQQSWTPGSADGQDWSNNGNQSFR